MLIMLKTYFLFFNVFIFPAVITTDNDVNVVVVEETPRYFLTLPRAFIIDNQYRFFVRIANTINGQIQITSSDDASFTGIKYQHDAFKFNGELSNGQINYQVPFSNPSNDRIHILFSFELCAKQSGPSYSPQSSNCQHGKLYRFNETIAIPILKNNLLIFGETSKPIYKPGELIRFRFLPIYPTTLKTSSLPSQFRIVKSSSNGQDHLVSTNSTSDQSFSFDEIVLEDPNRARMAQWQNVAWQQALQMSHQLTKDPVIGTWKLIARHKRQTEEHTFDVDEYVQPKFTVKIKPAKNVCFKEKFVKFSVCAQYSDGRPMKGTMKVKFCYRTLMPPMNHFGRMRPCFKSSIIMTGKKDPCYEFRPSSKLLHLDETFMPTMGRSQKEGLVFADVIEKGTGVKITKSARGGKIYTTLFKLKIDCSKYFKVGLPYYGTVTANKHSGEPMPFTNISISAYEHHSKWGFASIVTTDSQGRAEFRLPIFKVNKKFKLTFSQTKNWNDNPYVPGKYRLLIVKKYKYIKPFKSASNSFIQVYPLFLTPQTMELCPTQRYLILQSNVPVHNRIVHVQIVSRGQLVSAQSFDPVKDVCVDHDDELGHYKCAGQLTTSGEHLITCLPGWSGDNCVQPLCSSTTCLNGICSGPEKCLCKPGWIGRTCAHCVKKSGCINGDCQNGNDCFCKRGWSGNLCHLRNVWGSRESTNNRYAIDLGYNSHHRRRGRHRQPHVIPGSPDLRPIRPRPHSANSTPRPTTTVLNEAPKRNIFTRGISINISRLSLPNAKVIAYFVEPTAKGKAVVADTFDLTDLNNSCLLSGENSLFQFEVKESSPGNKITLNIRPDNIPQVCALRISDISLAAFGKAGGVDASAVIDELTEAQRQLEQDRQINPFDVQVSKMCGAGRRRIPFMRYLVGLTDGSDSAKMFEDIGIVTITNEIVYSRRCKKPDLQRGHPYREHCFMTPDGTYKCLNRNVRIMGQRRYYSRVPQFSPFNKLNMKAKIRHIFPETWKFEYVPLPNKTKSLNIVVPDSLTTWKANIYCTTNRGLWVPQPDYLKVTLPFYIHITLPYSIKRQEIASVPVKVFSYRRQCMQVVLQMQQTPGLELVSYDRVQTCICNEQQKTFYFRVVANVIGNVNIVVEALSSRSIFCSQNNETEDGRNYVSGDAVQRKLIVKPEGSPQEMNHADIICLKKPNKYNQLTHSFQLPGSAVQGSVRRYLFFSGDIMGPSLNNLDHLVKMPCGCGEQNMISMVPSIYVLDYFMAAKINKSDIIAKAKKYILSGFKRELNYRRTDGSYSAFGNRDSVGSTWLTAFVFKSFKEALPYMTSNRNDFQKALSGALDYLVKSQNQSSGCLQEFGKVFHSNMKGGIGIGNNRNVLLTAYLLTALENYNAAPAAFVSSSVRCIKEAMNTILISKDGIHSVSAYTVALYTHALSIHEPADSTLVAYLHSTLSKQAKKTAMTRYWTDRQAAQPQAYPGKSWKKGTSSEVETTAYAYLALAKVETDAELVKIIRWLTTQRNPDGGFYSTQDTVLGLKAISDFARRISVGQNLNISMEIQTANKTISRQVTEINKLVLNKIALLATDGLTKPETVLWNVSGTGCVYVQTSNLFNIADQVNTKAPFTLSVKSFQKPNYCKMVTLSICFAYTNVHQTSNMIIVVANPVSGWKFSSTAQDLLSRFGNNTLLKHIEKDSLRFVMYFDALDLADVSKRCVDLEMLQKVRVDKAKKAEIVLFDYYSPEISVEKFYDLKDCRNSNEIENILPNTTEPSLTQKQCLKICKSAKEKQTDTEAIRELSCSSKSQFFISQVKNGTSLRRMYAYYHNEFYSWNAELLPDKCNCLYSMNSTQNFVFFTSNPNMVILNKRINVNQEFTIINATAIVDIFARHIWCSKAIESSILLNSVFPNLTNKVTLVQQCPICINQFEYRLFFLVAKKICDKEIITISVNSTTNAINRTASVYRLNANRNITANYLAIPKSCVCPIERLSAMFTEPLRIYVNKSELLSNNETLSMSNARYVLMSETAYRGSGEFCALRK